MTAIMTLKSTASGLYLLCIAACCSQLCACNKNSDPAGNPVVYKLSYADSVLYPLGETNELQVITPVLAKTGTYTSFPDGLDINSSTGAINIHGSETGIKYRVYFTDGSITDSTLISIGGINYLDGVYKINAADSIINPVYNAVIGNSLPNAGSGSVYDEGGGCNGSGCAVNLNDAKINLAQTVRNGTFGATPVNGSNKEFTLNFRINDKSNKGGNKLKIKVFYFKTLNDITTQVWDLLIGRNGTVINSFNNSNNTPIQGNTGGNIVINSNSGKGRRPPCVVILSQ
jgi:hypothetical protein